MSRDQLTDDRLHAAVGGHADPPLSEDEWQCAAADLLATRQERDEARAPADVSMERDLGLVEGYLRGADVDPPIAQAMLRIRDHVLGRSA